MAKDARVEEGEILSKVEMSKASPCCYALSERRNGRGMQWMLAEGVQLAL